MALAVIDASVAVKWFLEEEGTAEALRLQEAFFEGILAIRVPAIFPWEVMNALRYSGQFPTSDLREAAHDLDRAGFATMPLFGAYLERTIELALALDITIYDASYVALAEILACPLYTADEALIGSAPTGVSVVSVEDYPPG